MSNQRDVLDVAPVPSSDPRPRNRIIAEALAAATPAPPGRPWSYLVLWMARRGHTPAARLGTDGEPADHLAERVTETRGSRSTGTSGSRGDPPRSEASKPEKFLLDNEVGR